MTRQSEACSSITDTRTRETAKRDAFSRRFPITSMQRATRSVPPYAHFSDKKRLMCGTGNTVIVRPAVGDAIASRLQGSIPQGSRTYDVARAAIRDLPVESRQWRLEARIARQLRHA